MKWLVQGAQPHDSLFFHYSGHGGQSVDLRWDNVNGYDDTIYPVDFQRTGQIKSEVYSTLPRPDSLGNAFDYGSAVACRMSSNCPLRLLSLRFRVGPPL